MHTIQDERIRNQSAVRNVVVSCREPVGDGSCVWGLLEGYMSDDPASAAVTDDLAAMQSAAGLAAGAVADIQRLEIASTRLGYLTPPVNRRAVRDSGNVLPRLLRSDSD